MMKKVVLFLAIVSFSSVAGITDITTKPVALIALKKNSAQYVDVCKAADDSCKEGTSIWKEKCGWHLLFNNITSSANEAEKRW
ncbi:hypothetical protein CDF01_08980 [Salmonella enterica]|nr:hypothetical protein [Salmonella enterica]